MMRCVVEFTHSVVGTETTLSPTVFPCWVEGKTLGIGNDWSQAIVGRNAECV